ncbi:hypothetical protein [Nostoc sp.]|uniref:hypothetical protein n=1 Tax=Nostoc sp. TaxID=1180 RepID=UPI002FF5E227
MISAQTPLDVESTLPDYTQLAESDGTFVFVERAGGKNQKPARTSSKLILQRLAAKQRELNINPDELV